MRGCLPGVGSAQTPPEMTIEAGSMYPTECSNIPEMTIEAGRMHFLGTRQLIQNLNRLIVTYFTMCIYLKAKNFCFKILA